MGCTSCLSLRLLEGRRRDKECEFCLWRPLSHRERKGVAGQSVRRTCRLCGDAQCWLLAREGWWGKASSRIVWALDVPDYKSEKYGPIWSPPVTHLHLMLIRISEAAGYAPFCAHWIRRSAMSADCDGPWRPSFVLNRKKAGLNNLKLYPQGNHKATPLRCTIPTHMATLYSTRYATVSVPLHGLS